MPPPPIFFYLLIVFSGTDLKTDKQKIGVRLGERVYNLNFFILTPS
jgi:hypothetical protein